jgi:hypothetical protein
VARPWSGGWGCEACVDGLEGEDRPEPVAVVWIKPQLTRQEMIERGVLPPKLSETPSYREPYQDFYPEDEYENPHTL